MGIVFPATQWLPAAPKKFPNGEPPGTSAPGAVETPEEAKPPVQRDSN
jgi:hypothetical protein